MATENPMEVDDGNGSGCEYATLACQWPGAVDATTVHLKVTFFDRQQKTVFMATAVVVENGAAVDSSGVYEGCVLREQAAMASCRRVKAKSEAEGEDDDEEKVRVWLRDARAALFGHGDHAADAEYVHSLQETGCSGNDQGPSGLMLRLSWKMKLRMIGMMVLGSVHLKKVAGMVPGQGHMSLGPVSSRFIEPLIECLLEERKQHQLSDREAASNAKQLLEDNQRLLDRLRSVADSRQLDDHRLIARFVEVLNAKKQKMVMLQQELSELKQQLQYIGSAAVTNTESREITVQQRGRGLGRQRKTKLNSVVQDRQLNNDPVVTKKKRPRVTQSSNNKWCSISSEEEEQRVDDVDTVLQNNDGSKLQRLDENMEIDDKSRASIVNIDHDTSNALLKTVMRSPSVVDVFDADTQIEYPDYDDKQPKQLELMEMDHKSSLAISKVNDVNPCVTDSETATETPKVVDYFTTDIKSDCPINDTSPNDSPPWFQLQTQKSPDKDVQKSPDKEISYQQPKQRNVLDDLWSGIL